MSTIADEGGFGKRSRFGGALAACRQGWLPCLLIGVIALVERHVVAANTDVSWLLTLSEKVLDGQRPYVDFIEVNPPASIYLYLPGVAIARAIGLSPERVTDGLVFIGLCGSLWTVGRTLSVARLLDGVDGSKLLALVAAVLAILPAQTFGEREHVAAILFLPMLAVIAVRASGERPKFGSILAAGCGAGLMIVIKPHLALGLLSAVLMATYEARSRAALFTIENWIVVAVVAAYGLIVISVFPQYVTDVVPILRVLYLPIHPLPIFTGTPAIPIWILTLGAIAVARRGKAPSLICRLLLASSFGFAAAFIIQGKGWPYHSYPMLAFALLALAFTIAEGRDEMSSRLKLGAWATAAGLLAAMTFLWMNLATSVASLVAPIRQIKPHPTMLVISHDPSIGHPLVREVGGIWVGRVMSMWMTAAAMWRKSHESLTPEEQAKIERYAALDRELLIDALRRAKPDLILIQKAPADWEAWARADQEIALLLRPYRQALTTGEVLVLRRDGK